MKLYSSFVGIDIGKKSFVVGVHGEKTTQEYDNDAKGIIEFIEAKKSILSTGLCVLEVTGGYEMRLLLSLCKEGFSVHRAPGRKVKNFIRSYGNEAKTDAIDAKTLARYGSERYESLMLFVPPSKHAVELYELAQRRRDLKQILVAEKNRRAAPCIEYIKDSIEKVIESLEASLLLISERMEHLVEADEELKKRQEVLMSIPGIGKIIATELLTLLPELGKVNRREIASLVGVAPISRDSGQQKGYRYTRGGRTGIKSILFMAAMSARRSNTSLRTYYESLVARGKKKMVALIALIRKIIVIANARLKELLFTSVVPTDSLLAGTPT
jgi:transposase